MVKYTETQNRIVATAHVAVSFIVVIAFIATVLWALCKAMSFASSVLIPVAVAFFLALFFKPYYQWWEKKIRIRSLALIVMLLTVLIPVALLVWWAGSTIVDEVTGFVRQIPDMFSRMFGWVEATFPRINDLLSQLTVACDKLADVVAKYTGNAVSAGASALSMSGDNVIPNMVVTNCGDVVVSSTSSVVPVVNEVVANGCASVTQTVAAASNPMCVNSNLVAVAPVAADTTVTNSLFNGINLDAEKLKELYALYGDSIKNAGMNLVHSGYDKLSGAISGGGAAVSATAAEASTSAAVVANATAASGTVLSKLGLAWTSCCSALASLGAGAAGLFKGVFYVLITTIFFVYFLLTEKCRSGKIVDGIPLLKDKTRKFIAKQIDAVVDIMVSFYQRQVLICLIEGCLYGLGFWLVGVPYGFIVGFLLGLINLVPFMGTVICLPLALVLTYFGNGCSLTRVILALAVWGFGQILDGYFITPKIQGDKTGLGYVGVIFSFLLWGAVLGPVLGLLLAIPLSACCVVLWRSFRDFSKSSKLF